MAPLRQNYPFGLVWASSVLLGLGVVGAAAQDNSAVAVAPQAALPASITANPSADWRNDIGTFKIGLVRGWSSDMSRLALGRVEKIFAKALGAPVKVVVFERFTSLMDAQADGRIDLAAYSARAFATVRLMCECVDALVTPATMAGDTGQIAILAGDASKVSSLAAIGSAKLGRVTTAPIATQEMLRGALLIGGKPVTGKEKFWVDYPDYAAAIKAYQNNEIDGVIIPAATSFATIADAGKTELGQLSEVKDGNSSRQATALWRSSFWPYGPVAVRNNLASEAKDILLRTLEQMDVTEPLAHATLSEGLSGPFRKTDSAGYANVSASIRLLVSQNANWR
jgi:phosphonate transport system substrate-binding protein